MKLRGKSTHERTGGLVKEIGRSTCNEEPSIPDIKGRNKNSKSEMSSSHSKRRTTVVHYIESRDSEEIETSKFPQKIKGKLKKCTETKSRVEGSSKVKEDTDLHVHSLHLFLQQKKETDIDERSRTLIVYPLLC